jgi:rRNA maturation endonuclease Nob1
MTKDEALKMAIELMERLLDFDGISSSDYIDVREACKEALEQPAEDYVLICKRCGDDLGLKMDDM